MNYMLIHNTGINYINIVICRHTLNAPQYNTNQCHHYHGCIVIVSVLYQWNIHVHVVQRHISGQVNNIVVLSQFAFLMGYICERSLQLQGVSIVFVL